MQAGDLPDANAPLVTWTEKLWYLQVAAKVDEGVKQLVRAEKSQKQSRLVLCIMLLGVAVIVMTVVVVFKKLLFG